MLPGANALWFVLALTAAAPQQDMKDKAQREELQQLQGKWQIELQEEDGKKLDANDLKGRTVIFGSNLLVIMRNNSLVQICALKLDPAKTPKTANAMVVDGKQKGDIMQGIYAVDGDTVTICIDTQGQQRPKEFKTTAGSGFMLLVCKRVQAKGEERSLVGKYESETVMLDGKKLLLDVSIERVGEAYLLTYTKGGGVAVVGTANWLVSSRTCAGLESSAPKR
jgi:uncharacterized protein (TIGR03067 family)